MVGQRVCWLCYLDRGGVGYCSVTASAHGGEEKLCRARIQPGPNEAASASCRSRPKVRSALAAAARHLATTMTRPADAVNLHCPAGSGFSPAYVGRPFRRRLSCALAASYRKAL